MHFVKFCLFLLFFSKLHDDGHSFYIKLSFDQTLKFLFSMQKGFTKHRRKHVMSLCIAFRFEYHVNQILHISRCQNTSHFCRYPVQPSPAAYDISIGYLYNYSGLSSLHFILFSHKTLEAQLFILPRESKKTTLFHSICKQMLKI